MAVRTIGGTPPPRRGICRAPGRPNAAVPLRPASLLRARSLLAEARSDFENGPPAGARGQRAGASRSGSPSTRHAPAGSARGRGERRRVASGRGAAPSGSLLAAPPRPGSRSEASRCTGCRPCGPPLTDLCALWELAGTGPRLQRSVGQVFHLRLHREHAKAARLVVGERTWMIEVAGVNP